MLSRSKMIQNETISRAKAFMQAGKKFEVTPLPSGPEIQQPVPE